jgi:sugar lactone lactonase YvrE
VNEDPLATITGSNTGLADPEGLAVDATGRIYVVANSASNYSVTVYAANPSGTLNEAPLATITGSNTGLNVPAGVALDSSGRIYVTNDDIGGNAQSVTVYPANPSGTLNEAPLATITGGATGLTDPIGITVDASGKIYVANEAGSVFVYAAIPGGGGTLDEAPLATIAGPSTTLREPLDVAVGSNGDVYVTDFTGSGGNGAIDVYAANPTGTLDEAPLATISGSNTALDGPAFLALDPSGRIYVTEPSTASILVYGAAPSGAVNEAPLATIHGSNTGLLAPYGIYVH